MERLITILARETAASIVAQILQVAEFLLWSLILTQDHGPR